MGGYLGVLKLGGCVSCREVGGCVSEELELCPVVVLCTYVSIYFFELCVKYDVSTFIDYSFRTFDVIFIVWPLLYVWPLSMYDGMTFDSTCNDMMSYAVFIFLITVNHVPHDDLR